MCPRSVVATFNSVQEKLGRGTCSSATALSWLKENRPKTSISPQKLDYCDLCVEYKSGVTRQETGCVNQVMQQKERWIPTILLLVAMISYYTNTKRMFWITIALLLRSAQKRGNLLYN